MKKRRLNNDFIVIEAAFFVEQIFLLDLIHVHGNDIELFDGGQTEI